MKYITLYLAAAGWTAFVVWYWIRAKWWKSDIGRNTMFVSMALAVALLRLVTQLIWPTTKHHVWSPIVFYGILAVLAVERIWQMERAQREGRRTVRYGRRKDDIGYHEREHSEQ
jgi:hypothetical protein